MTAFEHYFYALKKTLGQADLYDIWPDFEPQYDEQEHAWTTLRGLGDVLLLNCAQCDGPSDQRHSRCKGCVERREQLAKNSYQKTIGQSKQKWPTLILCRIYTQQH